MKISQVFKDFKRRKGSQVERNGGGDKKSGNSILIVKEMASHSTTLAWKIPWTEEHGRLQSMGLQRVEHD